MYSNNLRIMQNQEIKDNRSLTIISLHILTRHLWSTQLTIPWFPFRHANLFTLVLSVYTSSLTITSAYTRIRIFTTISSVHNISHSSIQPEQVATNHWFPMSLSCNFYLMNEIKLLELVVEIKLSLMQKKLH